MLFNEKPCESSDESYSAEDKKDGTNPICNQQPGRKQRRRMKNKTKTMVELQGVKLTTGNKKTPKASCVIFQKNKKGVATIGAVVGRKTIFKNAQKKMIWFWQEFYPQIQVIHSFIIQAMFPISHTKRSYNMKKKP